MKLEPRGWAFWSEEEREMWNSMAPSLLNLILTGGERGAALLPVGLQSLISWEVFNQAAIDYLHGYRMDVFANINETTRKKTVAAIDTWIKSGESMPVLQQRLSQFILSESRATQIAVTEVTRIYATGNEIAWTTSGVVGRKRWYMAVDERVCPICAGLHNQEVALQASFYSPFGGGGFPRPPAHVNCRCWIVPVVDETLVREQIRRMLWT